MAKKNATAVKSPAATAVDIDAAFSHLLKALVELGFEEATIVAHVQATINKRIEGRATGKIQEQVAIHILEPTVDWALADFVHEHLK